MKDEFVVTKNVRKLYKLADTLLEKDNGTPGLGLFYGAPGLGKSVAATHMHVQKNYVYLRAKTPWTVKWFLNDLLHELNEKEMGRTKDAYNRLVEVLSREPRLIIIDEVDHMLHDSKIIETMRDIHDESGNCFLLIGMQNIERKLKGFPHLYSRFADVIRAKPIRRDGILEISEKLVELPVLKETAEQLYELTNGELRKIITWLYYLEKKAQNNSLDDIPPDLLP